MREQPILFHNAGQQVVGMLHLPLDGKGPQPAVLFLHGFTGSKQEAHRMFVTTARRLAERGIASMRFDFRGSGDSEGRFADVTLGGEVSDAKAALEWLRARPEVDPTRVALVGMSMGGLVASYVLGADPTLRHAALWCPVAYPAALVQTSTPSQQQELAAGRPADYGGWPVGRAFVMDLLSFQPLGEIIKSQAEVLIIHGDQDESVAHANGEAYLKAMQTAGRRAELHIIAGADHTFSSLAWEQELIDRTVNWLATRL